MLRVFGSHVSRLPFAPRGGGVGLPATNGDVLPFAHIGAEGPVCRSRTGVRALGGEVRALPVDPREFLLAHYWLWEAGLTQAGAVPQFGWQKLQIRDPEHVIVQSTRETILAEKGEDLPTFLQRLVTAHGVGPADTVEVTFRAGAPQSAVIERNDGGCQEG